MEGMSERQYAAHVGLSRGAIQKAKEAGRLVPGRRARPSTLHRKRGYRIDVVCFAPAIEVAARGGT